MEQNNNNNNDNNNNNNLGLSPRGIGGIFYIKQERDFRGKSRPTLFIYFSMTESIEPNQVLNAIRVR